MPTHIRHLMYVSGRESKKHTLMRPCRCQYAPRVRHREDVFALRLGRWRIPSLVVARHQVRVVRVQAEPVRDENFEQ